MKHDVCSDFWDGHPIRRVEKDGEWWWVAADVCAALDIVNPRSAVEYICAKYAAAGICDIFSKHITL
jgi:prophage antirepressor-like protein